MKTKNTKARLKDIKAGVTLYVSHPVYGIEKLIVIGRPYIHKSVGSHFVQVKQESRWSTSGFFTDSRSLRDMGVTSTYNDRRSFFKLKHAEQWQKKWINNKAFQERQAAHERFCEEMDNLLNFEDYEYEGE